MSWIKGNLKTLVVAVVATLVGGALPAMAVAYDSNNSRAVDGLSAVKSNAKASARKGKLVATSPTTGKLPAGIIPKAPDSAKLGGKLPAAYTLDSEFLSLLPDDLADGDQTGGSADDVLCPGPCISEVELDFDPATQVELNDLQVALSAVGSDLSLLVTSLQSPGTLNDPGNPVDWTKLKGVPSDFADGTDATAQFAGSGGLLGTATTDARSDHSHSGLITNSLFASSLGFDPTTSELKFIGPTTNATITAGQKVLITATKALGSTGGASGLGLYMCHQLSGGPLIAMGQGILGIQVPAGTRIPMSLSAILVGVPAGTYTLGMCSSNGSSAWNLNEYGYITAAIF